MAPARPLSGSLVELVALRLRVLGQPVRLRLIERLDEEGPANVQTLADEMLVTQQNASKHLAALWRAGIVTRRQDGRVTVYSLTDGEPWGVIEQVAMSVVAHLREREADGPHVSVHRAEMAKYAGPARPPSGAAGAGDYDRTMTST